MGTLWKNLATRIEGGGGCPPLSRYWFLSIFSSYYAKNDPNKKSFLFLVFNESLKITVIANFANFKKKSMFFSSFSWMWSEFSVLLEQQPSILVKIACFAAKFYVLEKLYLVNLSVQKECTDYKVVSVSVWSRLRSGDLQTGGQGTVCVGTGSRRLRPGIPQRQVNYPFNLQLALTKKNAFSVTPAIQTEHVP